jgi:hypothetical protein
LVNKEPLLIERLWGCSIVRDIPFNKLCCFKAEGYLPIVVSLAQDDQGVVVGIKVLQGK